MGGGSEVCVLMCFVFFLRMLFLLMVFGFVFGLFFLLVGRVCDVVDCCGGLFVFFGVVRFEELIHVVSCNLLCIVVCSIGFPDFF